MPHQDDSPSSLPPEPAARPPLNAPIWSLHFGAAVAAYLIVILILTILGANPHLLLLGHQWPVHEEWYLLRTVQIIQDQEPIPWVGLLHSYDQARLTVPLLPMIGLLLFTNGDLTILALANSLLGFVLVLLLLRLLAPQAPSSFLQLLLIALILHLTLFNAFQFESTMWGFYFGPRLSLIFILSALLLSVPSRPTINTLVAPLLCLLLACFSMLWGFTAWLALALASLTLRQFRPAIFALTTLVVVLTFWFFLPRGATPPSQSLPFQPLNWLLFTLLYIGAFPAVCLAGLDAPAYLLLPFAFLAVPFFTWLLWNAYRRKALWEITLGLTLIITATATAFGRFHDPQNAFASRYLLLSGLVWSTLLIAAIPHLPRPWRNPVPFTLLLLLLLGTWQNRQKPLWRYQYIQQSRMAVLCHGPSPVAGRSAPDQDIAAQVIQKAKQRGWGAFIVSCPMEMEILP